MPEIYLLLQKMLSSEIDTDWSLEGHITTTCHKNFTAACCIHGFKPKLVAKTMDVGTLCRLCTEKLGLAVTPLFPLQNYLHVKAIFLSGDYTWEIYGSRQKNLNINSKLDLLESYLEEQLPHCCLIDIRPEVPYNNYYLQHKRNIFKSRGTKIICPILKKILKNCIL